MSPLSVIDAEMARKNEATILRALASVGQNTVAGALDVNESTVSRMKDGEIQRMATILSTLHLKAVPTSMRCYPAQQIEAIFTLARAHLRTAETVADLHWDENV